jgi:hypothetical protein
MIRWNLDWTSVDQLRLIWTNIYGDVNLQNWAHVNSGGNAQ